MKNTLLAKTLTASLPGNPQDIFARISDPENLPQWHSAFCRSLRKENGGLVVESPRGPISVRFVRNDHGLVLDILAEVKEGIELLHAIRLLPNGEGSEMTWTLVKAEGIPDAIFHEQLRWAGSALHQLRKAPAAKIEKTAAVAPPASGAEATLTEPLQTPSAEETKALPLSGKKLFIGNLSYDWTDEPLRAHFAEAGTVVSAEVARFRGRGGRSRGFGFVEMSSETEAQSAIEKFHDQTAGGRKIIVRLAKSQEPRPVQTPAPADSPSEAMAPEERPEPGNEITPVAEPGNEREPRAPASRQRPVRPKFRGRSRSVSAAPRSYQGQDFVNKSGYEIFPRRTAGQALPERSPDAAAAPRSKLEASPYMEDTGDIENHGRRPPARRRRR